MAAVNEDEMKRRTKQFALRSIQLAEALSDTRAGRVIGNQLLRSGTSVGANYRAACRARSVADFIHKIGITLEEADESAYWMELVIEAKLLSDERIAPLLREANELTAILSASHKTASTRLKQANRKSKIEN